MAAFHGHALDGGVHGRKALGLHADDLDVRLDGLGGGGDARDQAAAADAHHYGVQVWARLQHFERHRTLPGNHGWIVVGMDHDQAALARQFVAARLGVVEGVAGQDDFGAEAPRVGHLDRGSEARHDDHRRHAHALRVVRHALGMVAGRHGDHAGGALGLGQVEHPVEGAALLERGGELQVLELQPDFGAEDIGQRAGMRERRIEDLSPQDVPGGLDGGKIDHDGGVWVSARYPAA
ncbi:Uncharacterised protein [Bordetella pertussis]|nr:Uncharacterised protein [Bordetella pertussis]CPK25400.1 Uncharacterised protein [Bordetella pertussis]CPP28114.1 Uncharacterised protein [Bordetella pertussis]CPP81991.1 Uncharacterised protein [Bordetella pertussis]CRE32476.1 Uncharacterised protein [Bordetella pertussis]